MNGWHIRIMRFFVKISSKSREMLLTASNHVSGIFLCMRGIVQLPEFGGGVMLVFFKDPVKG